MPPERRPPDDPREWLNRARSAELVTAEEHQRAVVIAATIVAWAEALAGSE